jgi:oligoribonuclease
MSIGSPSMTWVDLETTGLEPHIHIPLELGLAITDDELNILHQKSWLIQPAVQPHWDKLPEKVQTMHGANGLRKAIENGEGLGLWDVIEEAVDWLDHHGGVGFPMCGNSVAGFDRPWLRVHFPVVEKLFHYRHIDVSTVKELCRRWNPRVYEHAPVKNENHRVLPDLHESIAELGYYMDEFFMVDLHELTGPTGWITGD